MDREPSNRAAAGGGPPLSGAPPVVGWDDPFRSGLRAGGSAGRRFLLPIHDGARPRYRVWTQPDPSKTQEQDVALFRSSSEEAADRPAAAEVPVPTPRGGGDGGDSVVAEGMVVRGDCEARGALRVNGHVTGDVLAPRVSVGPTGRVDGSVAIPGGGHTQGEVRVDGRVAGAVQAERVEVGRDGYVGRGLQAAEAVVHGRVSGGINAARRLLLEATAVVEGDIETDRLAIREDATLAGALRVGRLGGGTGASAKPASDQKKSGGEAAARAAAAEQPAGPGSEKPAASASAKAAPSSSGKAGASGSGAATPGGKP